MKFPRFLQRREKEQPVRQPDFSAVTEEDIFYCYRLLLNRIPDEAGARYWQEMINRFHISIPFLVSGFVNSSEFKNLQAKQMQPHLVELPRFQIYVRLNDFFIGAAIAHAKMYEPAVTQEIEHLLHPGAVFVDIGANIGYFSLLAASLVGAEGRVFAFEPKPDNCHLLRESLEVNGFANVTVYQNAVAETAQTFSFTNGGADSNGRLLHDFEIDDPSLWLTVEAVTLDETLPFLPRLDVVKMDIEGAEPRAWQGMGQTIGRYHPTIIMEFSPSFIETTSRTNPAAFLEELQQKYSLYILHPVESKSQNPQTTTQILQCYTDSGLTHLDLVAYPH